MSRRLEPDNGACSCQHWLYSCPEGLSQTMVLVAVSSGSSCVQKGHNGNLPSLPEERSHHLISPTLRSLLNFTTAEAGGEMVSPGNTHCADFLLVSVLNRIYTQVSSHWTMYHVDLDCPPRSFEFYKGGTLCVCGWVCVCVRACVRACVYVCECWGGGRG